MGDVLRPEKEGRELVAVLDYIERRRCLRQQDLAKELLRMLKGNGDEVNDGHRSGVEGTG
jgi:hypothetical protein